jgi:hypothetical protein
LVEPLPAGSFKLPFRRKGATKRLRYSPNGTGSELLINRMVEGGPQALSAVLAYLAEARVDADRAES